MSYRTLFHEIMFYGDFSRMPVWHTGEWEETASEWVQQGLPREVSRNAYFGTVGFPWTVPTHLGPGRVCSRETGCDKDVGMRAYNMLFPPFPEETLEETDRYRVVRQGDGVIVKELKTQTSLPGAIEYSFQSGADWEKYEARLQPHPDRIPDNIDQVLLQMRDADEPLRVRTGSLVGVIRNWMGVENFGYLQHDDPGLVGEIVDTISDLVCWELEQLLPKTTVDLGWFWEDICFNSGPLVSPTVFNRYFVPGYSKVTAKLRAHGVELCAVDSDGLVDKLIPGWLEGGVNILYPVEIVNSDTDPMRLRKQFGRKLRLIGGIDKKEILKGEAAIDAEIERRLPLMKDGGYIPTPDHEVLPGTPLAAYRYYLDRIRSLRF